MSKISFVIPTRNEPEIEKLIKGIMNMKEKIGGDIEILVIDRSDDDTPLKASESGARVHRQRSTGLGGALKEGLSYAKGEIIFTLDADLSHDPKYIPKFLEEVDRGSNIVVGSRKMKGGSVVGWGLKRKATSWGANMIGKYIGGVNVSDLTSGYRAYTKKVIGSIDLEGLGSSGYSFQLEVLSEALRRGFRVGGVPIVFKDRVKGESKLGLKDIMEFLRVSFKLFTKRILRS